MKKKLFLLAAMGMLTLFSAGNVFAADVTAAVDVNSAYVWRGITFNDGLVVQPSVDVTSGGFGLNVWGNLDADDYDDTLESGEFSEIDLTASYGFTVKSVSVTVGYIEYLFPAGGPGTREVYGGIGIEPVKGLTTGVDVYWDFDEVEDVYVNVKLGYNLDISDKLSMDFNASAGYAGEDMSAGTKDGFHDYNLSIGLGYAATDALNLSGFIAYTNSFDDEVLPDQDVDIYGGVGGSYSF
ncbi:MAG: TorF family putative porin [Desulfobacterales bacterium]